MAVVKNPIISTLGNMIGLSPTPSPLILDETNLSLVLPVVPDVARRSGAGIEAGWFVGLLENVHSAADSESSFIDPYNPGANSIAPYPEIVPIGYDVWLIGVSGTRSAGSGGLTGAIFVLNPGDTSQGWGQDDAGAAVVGTPSIRLALFDSISELVQAVATDPMITEQGATYVPIGIRIPRNSLLGFETEAAAAAEFQGQFLLGLFPAGLGQDVGT